jgi:hypothetical protein
MLRTVMQLVVLAPLAALPLGCSTLGFDIGPWGGPAYKLDLDTVGTGEQAIVPRNDYSYANGEPLDYRTRR